MIALLPELEGLKVKMDFADPCCRKPENTASGVEGQKKRTHKGSLFCFSQRFAVAAAARKHVPKFTLSLL